MTEKKRTLSQNRALHLMFDHMAGQLNEAGLDMKKALKPEVDIPWTKQTIKDFMWRPVQEAMLQKESTTELTTKEIDQVFDVLCRHLGEKFGMRITFPSIETVMLETLIPE